MHGPKGEIDVLINWRQQPIDNLVVRSRHGKTSIAYTVSATPAFFRAICRNIIPGTWWSTGVKRACQPFGCAWR